MAGAAIGDALCEGDPPFGPTETPRNDARLGRGRGRDAALAAVVSCKSSTDSQKRQAMIAMASPSGAIAASNRDESNRPIGLSGGKPHQVHELQHHEGAPPVGVTACQV